MVEYNKIEPSNSRPISAHVAGLCRHPPPAAALDSILLRHSASSPALHSTTTTRPPDAISSSRSRWARLESGESTTTLKPKSNWVAADRHMASYDRSLRRFAAASVVSTAVCSRARWIGSVESRKWSLSMSGNLRALARAFASVLFPVPGWPFMAIRIGLSFVPCGLSNGQTRSVVDIIYRHDI
ncbi:chaperone DnaJ-domain superfamily protein [Striga asiatica]|uniref:Chaperone DnaJ-domain superfamily protein n=1 Tax=Striga asiatica TaxID=4170 RepID=A0A5A7QPK9_STRAF|nr:chaperone DnaJ-domain superfamily protein [Striga asiatica]